MASLPILSDLPAGFAVRRGERGVLAVRAELDGPLARAGFAPDGGGELAPSDLYGRRPLAELELGGARFVVRRFRHGGLLRWLTGSRFLDGERPFRELVLSARLAALGLRTPEVVAARAVAAGGGGWRLDVITRKVEDALDLGHVAAARARGETSDAQWRALLRAAGAFVRTLHDAGLAHADLTPRNLLVERASLSACDPLIWVVDLDRSELAQQLAREGRRTNLRRLHRHVLRLALEGRARMSRADVARFLAGYEPDRAARKADWRAIERDHAGASALHSTGWLLERRLGRRASDAR